jgi:hypothetical protein
MDDSLKKNMLRVIAGDDDINSVKNFLGLGLPEDEAKTVNAVLNDVYKNLERAAEDLASDVDVQNVEDYLKENGYDSWQFWSEIRYCIKYRIDRAKVDAVMAKYGPTK